MTGKAKRHSPFDACLHTGEAVLWSGQQAWFNGTRITRGYKIAWLTIALLIVLLTILASSALRFDSILRAYGIVAVYVGVYFIQGWCIRWMSGDTEAENEAAFFARQWYAVTNQRLLWAGRDRVESIPLPEVAHIRIESDASGRGRMELRQPGKTLHFTDIPDVDEVHRLILEQQQFMQRQES